VVPLDRRLRTRTVVRALETAFKGRPGFAVSGLDRLRAVVIRADDKMTLEEAHLLIKLLTPIGAAAPE
jgi:hypothetical protein